ncbi:MAG TPA: DUF502 domain-containing protein [Opitutaceae bacterium]
MPEPGLFAKLRAAFIAGLFMLAPIAVTLIVAGWLLNQVGGRFRNYFFFYVPEDWLNNPNLALLWNLAGTFIVVILITVLGLLSRWVLGKYFGGVAERFISNIPGVSAIYSTVKQIVTTFSSSKRSVFSKVVIIQFPRKGVYSLGFLTNEAQGEVQAKTAEHVWTIFVPTTPNPTSGYLVMVPKDEVVELDMSIGDGMKLVISGGTVTPPYPYVAPVHVENPVEPARLA